MQSLLERRVEMSFLSRNDWWLENLFFSFIGAVSGNNDCLASHTELMFDFVQFFGSLRHKVFAMPLECQPWGLQLSCSFCGMSHPSRYPSEKTFPNKVFTVLASNNNSESWPLSGHAQLFNIFMFLHRSLWKQHLNIATTIHVFI